MTRKALARRIAEPYLTSQQRREAPAPPQPEGLRGFWPGALLLVSQRPQRVFSFLAPRTQPKFAAALLYEPQTWCTKTGPVRYVCDRRCNGQELTVGCLRSAVCGSARHGIFTPEANRLTV
jgi:hypothetical protein